MISRRHFAVAGAASIETSIICPVNTVHRFIVCSLD